MSELHPRVAEFREIVDHLIDQAAARLAEGSDYHRKGMETTVAGLKVAIYNSDEHRSIFLPHYGEDTYTYGEHMWTISSGVRRPRSAGGGGNLVLISHESDPVGLDRVWHGAGAMVTRHLVAVGELDAAVGWVRSPHLAEDELDIITAHTPEQIDKLNSASESIRRATEREALIRQRFIANSLIGRPRPPISPLRRRSR